MRKVMAVAFAAAAFAAAAILCGASAAPGVEAGGEVRYLADQPGESVELHGHRNGRLQSGIPVRGRRGEGVEAFLPCRSK